MGASKWQVIWHVIVPAALPEILTGMRIAIGFGWTTLVARRNGRERPRAWADGAQRVKLFAHRHRDHGHHRDGVVAYLFDLLMRRIEAVAGARGRGGVAFGGNQLFRNARLNWAKPPKGEYRLSIKYGRL